MHISGLGLPDLLKAVNNPVGIEVGLNRGATTKHLFDNLPNLVLHGVDPYFEYNDWDGNILTPSEREWTYTFFLKHIAQYQNRIIHYRMISDDAEKLLPNNSFDFVFIDGLHTYEQVAKDCKNYYPKVKSGGLFSGHDFNAIPGVRRAVIEFATSVNAVIKQTDNDVWYWIKP